MDNGLPELPGELADKISSYLPPSDVANMSKTSKALHSSLKYRTISRAETLRSRLETALLQDGVDPFYDVIYEALITYVTKYPFMYRRSVSGTTTDFMTWYEPNPRQTRAIIPNADGNGYTFVELAIYPSDERPGRVTDASNGNVTLTLGGHTFYLNTDPISGKGADETVPHKFGFSEAEVGDKTVAYLFKRAKDHKLRFYSEEVTEDGRQESVLIGDTPDSKTTREFVTAMCQNVIKRDGDILGTFVDLAM